MHIHCFQTGGTIDKHYPRGTTHHGYNFEITDPAVERILEISHISFPFTVTSLLKKDSLDITDEDRALIVSSVSSSPRSHILITHGTDTVLKTAEALEAAHLPKVIVLTGAMLPECFKGTDANFNIGLAVGALQTKEPGVYIALYGQIFTIEAFRTFSV
ncbi:MAG: hypothetical protein RI911_810 [Candidatus Parcubacteria bacterium]|jgi:L-asparaginase